MESVTLKSAGSERALECGTARLRFQIPPEDFSWPCV